MNDLAHKKHQRDRILGLLIAAHGKEVPLSAIMDLRISQYNRCIVELRQMGFNIPSPRIEMVNGTKRTFYRLITGPANFVSPETKLRPLSNVSTPPQSLFGDIRPDRSYTE